MEKISFIFTIFFMLLGPVKIIPAFAALTKSADRDFKRAVAIRGALIATGIGVFLMLMGGILLEKYQISLDALRIAGGIVLLLAALNAIFPKSQPSGATSGTPTAIRLAVSPVATPIVVPPAGVAAVLLFVMVAPQFPGMMAAIAICLGIVMILDFLVMFFIDKVAGAPGLMLFIQVLGSVLVFMQVGLAVDTILSALQHLGAFAS